MAEAVPRGTRPGPVGFRISPVTTQGIDWPRLDAAWALAGAQDAISAAWFSDHLANLHAERGGTGFESLTTVAALAHRVPGKWIGIAVLANTFRHPALVAKAATAIDNATGGRFVLGLGAGWHVGEHEAFGIPLPPMKERFARYESAVAMLVALFSDAGRHSPGVTRDDPYYPLDRATLDPAPVRPEGPQLWLGGQGPRGIALAARYADGWPLPGAESGNVPYFVEKREALLRAMDAAGRDPTGFIFAAQVGVENTAASRRQARESALEFRRHGANHVILGVPAPEGPDGIEAMALEVAEPLRDAAG